MVSFDSRGLSDRISDLLLERILRGELGPGQRLSETALAEELGVSRTPVREALKVLTGSGLIEAIPRRGFFVRGIDASRLRQALDLRYILEMYAAEQGIETVSQEELSKMESLLEECAMMLKAHGAIDYGRYVRRDCDLHRLIVKTSRNELLIDFYGKLSIHLQLAFVRFAQPVRSMRQGHEEHVAIVQAYQSKDKDSLLQALGGQLQRSRGEILGLAENLA